MTIREQQIIFLYNDGKSYQEIGSSLHISFCSISKVIKENNLPKRTPWNKGSTKQTDLRIKTPKTSFKQGHDTWNKGIKVQTNTGRTHFKKGRISERKGKNIEDFYKTEETCDKMRKVSRENAKRLVKKLNKCDTLIERMVENLLLFHSINYIKQFKYELGVADFWLPEINTIIECDGDYWHSLPGYSERDKNQTEFLEQNDFIVLRFKGSEIRNNFNFVKDTILEQS